MPHWAEGVTAEAAAEAPPYGCGRALAAGTRWSASPPPRLHASRNHTKSRASLGQPVPPSFQARESTEKAGSSWRWPSLPVLGKQNRWSPFWGVRGGGGGSGGGAEERGRTGPVASSGLLANGEPPPHAGQLPASSEPRDQGNLILCSAPAISVGRGQGQLLVPSATAPGRAPLCGPPSWEGRWGRKGGASRSSARPSLRRWAQEPWVPAGRGCPEGPGPSLEEKSRKGPVGMRGLLVDGLKGKEVLESAQ